MVALSSIVTMTGLAVVLNNGPKVFDLLRAVVLTPPEQLMPVSGFDLFLVDQFKPRSQHSLPTAEYLPTYFDPELDPETHPERWYRSW